MINVVGDCHAAEGMLVEQIRYLMRLFFQIPSILHACPKRSK